MRLAIKADLAGDYVDIFAGGPTLVADIAKTVPGAAATSAFLKLTRATQGAPRAALDEKQRMADAAVA